MTVLMPFMQNTTDGLVAFGQGGSMQNMVTTAGNVVDSLPKVENIFAAIKLQKQLQEVRVSLIARLSINRYDLMSSVFHIGWQIQKQMKSVLTPGYPESYRSILWPSCQRRTCAVIRGRRIFCFVDC